MAYGILKILLCSPVYTIVQSAKLFYLSYLPRPQQFDTVSDEEQPSTKHDEAEQSEHSTDNDDDLMANPNHQEFTDDEEDE